VVSLPLKLIATEVAPALEVLKTTLKSVAVPVFIRFKRIEEVARVPAEAGAVSIRSGAIKSTSVMTPGINLPAPFLISNLIISTKK
jgi:hypothetical protein